MSPQIGIIFLTVFIYLVGFGMVIPLIPMIGRDFGATPAQVGLLMTVYSLMQFICAPFWGRLSDRLGRRPILLFCLLGESLACLAFAWAKNLEMLFLARIFAGFFGASISTASAYISDITGPKERSKGMGIIGAAFGLGFVVGPALGGALAWWGGMALPLYFVAGLCLVNFLFGIRYLKESLSLEKRANPSPRESRLKLFLRHGAKPIVNKLMLVFFLATFAMACMEATLILFVGDRFNWGLEQVSFGFAYIGIIAAFTQGYLVRKLIPKFGEKTLLLVGLFLMTLGLGGIGFAHSIPFLAGCMTLLAFGISFTNPTIMGSISLLTSEDEQGITLGLAQSMSALGRVVGPAFGGFIYGVWVMGAPFWISGLVTLLGVAVVLSMFKLLPQTGKISATTPARAGSGVFTTSDKIGRIGYFQLSNLHTGRVPFLLFSTGMNLEKENLSTEIKAMLHQSTEVSKHNVVDEVKKRNPSPSVPVILLCADETKSLPLAQEVELAGFMNTYIVRGGLKGLIAESGEN